MVHRLRRAIWYPRDGRPALPAGAVEWREASGEGTVYAVSVHHRPGPGRDAADGPYVVALVELAEGVRMMSNVVGCPPDAVTVGDAGAPVVAAAVRRPAPAAVHAGLTGRHGWTTTEGATT